MYTIYIQYIYCMSKWETAQKDFVRFKGAGNDCA